MHFLWDNIINTLSLLPKPNPLVSISRLQQYISMAESFFKKLSPTSIGKNLWGAGKMPLKWKLLFTAQSFIFVSAMFMRQVDVENAQRRKLEEVKEDDGMMNGNGATGDVPPAGIAPKESGR